MPNTHNKTLTRRFAGVTAALYAVILLAFGLFTLVGCNNNDNKDAVIIDPQIRTLIDDGVLNHDTMQATCTAALNAQIAAEQTGDMLPIGLISDLTYKKSSGTSNLTGSTTIRTTGSERVLAVNQYSNGAVSWVYDENTGNWTNEINPCYMPNLKVDHLINPDIKRDTGVYIITSQVEPEIICQIINRAASKILIDPQATNMKGNIELKYDVNTNLPVSLRLEASTDTETENASTTGIKFDLTSFTINMNFTRFSDVSVKLPKDLPAAA